MNIPIIPCISVELYGKDVATSPYFGYVSSGFIPPKYKWRLCCDITRNGRYHEIMIYYGGYMGWG